MRRGDKAVRSGLGTIDKQDGYRDRPNWDDRVLGASLTGTQWR
jgi:hypothetical protein